MKWGDGWFVLQNGHGFWLDDLCPCSCGQRIFLVSQSMVFCSRCIKPKQGETVLGWFDVDERIYHQGLPDCVAMEGR